MLQVISPLRTPSRRRFAKSIDRIVRTPESVSPLEPGRHHLVDQAIPLSAADAWARLIGVHEVYDNRSDSGVTVRRHVEHLTPLSAIVRMRSPQYYALNLNRLPQGSVKVAGNGNNTRVSTDDTARMSMLLDGGASRLHQLNRQYVAAQLSLLAAGSNPTALGSNLVCYKLNFQPTQISTGVFLNPEMTVGELFDQVQKAGRSGNVIDQRLLINVLEQLNGTEPQGRCGP